MAAIRFVVAYLAVLLASDIRLSVGASDVDTTGSLRFLLGGEHHEFSFFETHFGREPFIVKDSARDDRRLWMETHRKFLQHEDIDGLLKANTSAVDPDRPLLLGKDVDMLRIAKEDGGFWGRARIASFFSHRDKSASKNSGQPGDEGTSHGKPSAGAPTDDSPIVDHSKVHEAFKDGFEIVVYHMEARSRQVHLFSEQLSSFWMVPVTSSLHFTPAKTNQVREKAPIFHASDAFLVQLDGEQEISLYPNAFDAPFLEHTLNAAIRAEVTRGLADAEPENVTLAEGDVLYIPRGYASDIRTSNKISLAVKFSVATYACVIVDALSEIISRAEELDAGFGEENPLQTHINSGVLALEGGPSSGSSDKASAFRDVNKVSFGEVLRIAAQVTAQMNPKMREYFPISKLVVGAMEEADVTSAETMLLRNLNSFTEAGKQALFGPLLSVLEEGTDELNAPQEVVEWAKRLHAGGADSMPTIRAGNMFQRCLQFIHNHRDGLVQAASERLREEHAASEAKNRPQRMALIERVLERHGQERSSDTCDTSSGGMCRA